jgi:glycosyltransferase involved in cell wall biosynthesis
MGPQPLRVALLSYRSKPHSGGQGVYVRNLSRELVALGHRVEVFSGPPYPELDAGVPLTKLPSLDLYRESDPFRIPHLREFRSPVDLLEWAMMGTAAFPEPLTFSLRARAALRARRGEFDIVHDNQGLGYGLLDLLRSGLPVVATVHHPVTVDRRLELAAAPSLWRRMTLRRWYSFTRMQTRVVRRLPALLTVSEASRADIAAEFGVESARLTVVPVGVDPLVFHPPGAADPPRVPGRIVVTTSADVPLKGLVTLLEALAKVRTEQEAHLVVVGNVRAGGPAALAVDQLGLGAAVRFVSGLTDGELAQLLRSASVAVVPSLYEGFSLPAIEAMASGTPLVVTTAGALPEVVGPDGLAAIHTPPGDAEAMAKRLRELLADPQAAARLGEAGRARVLQRFTWRATAASTAAWYGEVLARWGAPC